MWTWLKKLLNSMRGEEWEDEQRETTRTQPMQQTQNFRVQAKAKSIYPKERQGSIAPEDRQSERPRQFRFPVIPDQKREAKAPAERGQADVMGGPGRSAERQKPFEKSGPLDYQRQTERTGASERHKQAERQAERERQRRAEPTSPLERKQLIEQQKRDAEQPPEQRPSQQNFAQTRRQPEVKKPYKPTEIFSPIYGKVDPRPSKKQQADAHRRQHAEATQQPKEKPLQPIWPTAAAERAINDGTDKPHKEIAGAAQRGSGVSARKPELASSADSSAHRTVAEVVTEFEERGLASESGTILARISDTSSAAALEQADKAHVFAELEQSGQLGQVMELGVDMEGRQSLTTERTEEAEATAELAQREQPEKPEREASRSAVVLDQTRLHPPEPLQIHIGTSFESRKSSFSAHQLVGHDVGPLQAEGTRQAELPVGIVRAEAAGAEMVPTIDEASETAIVKTEQGADQANTEARFALASAAEVAAAQHAVIESDAAETIVKLVELSVPTDEVAHQAEEGWQQNEVAEEAATASALTPQVDGVKEQAVLREPQAVLAESRADGVEEQAVLTESQANGVEEQAESTEPQADGVEEQAVLAESRADDMEEQAVLTESQANGVAEQAESTEPQADGVKEQAILAESQADVAEEQAVLVESQATVVVQQPVLTEPHAAAIEQHGSAAPFQPPATAAQVNAASSAQPVQLPSATDESPAAPATTPIPAESAAAVEPVLAEAVAKPVYIPPQTSLLTPSPEATEDDVEYTQEQKGLLEETLSNFNVNANVVGIVKGPSVTRFELQPAPGVKVNKITGLSDDIKLSLSAKDIRIEAPIPGRNAVGIEVPNRKSEPVFISRIIESEKFRNHPSPLAIALGMDIGGEPIVADIKKMPHGLIAGSTGSGKSVCINSIIVSLLFKASPEQVRLLLIDPKMVELAPYNHLPHLITPVVTEAKQATASLKWAVEEMERRYTAFVDAGVRDIDRYNTTTDEPLPYIVIIIDELADLMMVSPQDVEDCIIRIAQKARACGIHLLLATQRPSVDVITGNIKANVPTRLAFAVFSQIDSRTILDQSGAERLLGRGDMLFLESGATPIRLQGNFVSDDEIEQVTQMIKKQRKPNYFFSKEDLEQQVQAFDAGDDPLYLEALMFVADQGQASASALQRRFRVGYNRAARLIEMMEAEGHVAGQAGGKPRAVLISREDAQALTEGTSLL